jgi:hypothetical protein
MSFPYLGHHLRIHPGDRSRADGKPEIGLMKSSAWIVNTSRGRFVDESTLVEALQARRSRAAVDVFDRDAVGGSSIPVAANVADAAIGTSSDLDILGHRRTSFVDREAAEPIR